MPVPHFNIKITQRSKGKSAVAGAAYQAGEKLFSEYDQKTKNYTCKKEVVYTEIMLPPNAPPEYADRAALWNSVEEIEKQWNSQLARRFVAALPREVPMELLPQMVKEYCEEHFVSKGMCCDFAIHDPDPPGHNPHCHFMLTMRAIDENGKWLPKSRKVYDLDENGERIKLPSGRWKSHKEDMELVKIGERKQAIFCILPDSNDASLNFLVGMLYTQAFQELYYQADKIHQGALPVPVRLMFDEFANVALPDGYARLQATMRSRNIMSTIILQNISQLKALFKDDWEGIIGNADSFIYLGGNEQSTHKYISELLGKETIDTRTSSQSKGRNGSFSQNFQQTGRELMTPDEVRRLDNKNAIVLIRGEKPVIDEKYDILKHPNIHRTEDGGASPYLHTPLRAFAADDLSFPIENIDDIEFLED